MVKKVIWAIVELVTIAIGTGIFVTSTLDSYVDEEIAGIGAFMVVFGLLLRNWRKDLFSSSNSTQNKTENIEKKTSDKNVILGVLLIFAFTLWGLNYGNIGDNQSDINSLENKVEDLEDYSHYH